MAYLDNGGKRACCVWHRRGGKDLVFGHQTCKLAHQRKGAYWHVFPTAEQGRKAIWEGFTKDGLRIMEALFPVAIRKSPREFLPKAEMVVELKCGSIWRLVGSDKISLVGAGPVGVVFSEYSLAKPSAWNFIAPMLDENEGWAAFAYTPRGNNHGKKLYDMARQDKSWYCSRLTLFDTRAYNPEATIAAARARGMPEPLIQQEYLCDFNAALVGSVWGDLVAKVEDRGGLDAFTHEVDGVFTNWDLGISDSTSIWWWRLTEDGVDFIDHYSSHGKPMSHYFDVVDARAKERGYKYEKHWLPHDARARSLQTGVSILDMFFQKYGQAAVAIGPELSLMDGIQAGRKLLQRNVRFHPRCAAGVESLRHYHYEYDEDRNTFGAKPEHDWASHDADGFRYTACVVEVSDVLTRKPKPPAPKPMARPLSSYTLNDAWGWQKPKQGGRL